MAMPPPPPPLLLSQQLPPPPPWSSRNISELTTENVKQVPSLEELPRGADTRSVATSALTLQSTMHSRERRAERGLEDKRLLKHVVKHGSTRPSTSRDGRSTLVHTKDGISVVTDATKRVEVTAWQVERPAMPPPPPPPPLLQTQHPLPPAMSHGVTLMADERGQRDDAGAPTKDNEEAPSSFVRRAVDVLQRVRRLLADVERGGPEGDAGGQFDEEELFVMREEAQELLDTVLQEAATTGGSSDPELTSELIAALQGELARAQDLANSS